MRFPLWYRQASLASSLPFTDIDNEDDRYFGPADEKIILDRPSVNSELLANIKKHSPR
jgi:hypothetical protein